VKSFQAKREACAKHPAKRNIQFINRLAPNLHIAFMPANAGVNTGTAHETSDQ